MRRNKVKEKKQTNYVNNMLLYRQVLIWKTMSVINQKPDEIYQVPTQIAIDIMKISKNLTRRWNFVGYTEDWKEEMYWDGVESTLRGLINYNEQQYRNVFAYISKACFNAFLQRIAKERREVTTQYRYFMDEVYDALALESDREIDEIFIQDIQDKIDNYEGSVNNAKERALNRKQELELEAECNGIDVDDEQPPHNPLAAFFKD